MSDNTDAYGEITHNSPNPLIRFSHRQRLALAARIIDPNPGERILDFGGGDGFVVSGLVPQSPGTQYTILEPYLIPHRALALRSDAVTWVKNDSELPKDGFDKIICLEVLEHLSEPALVAAMTVFREKLKPGGFCVVSMPLEVGPPALFKNAVRLLAGRLHGGTTLGRVLRSAVFDTRDIPRPAVEGFVAGHIGFNAFDTLSRVLRDTGFHVVRRMTSPVRFLPWYVNSQMYVVLRRPA